MGQQTVLIASAGSPCQGQSRYLGQKGGANGQDVFIKVEIGAVGRYVGMIRQSGTAE